MSLTRALTKLGRSVLISVKSLCVEPNEGQKKKKEGRILFSKGIARENSKKKKKREREREKTKAKSQRTEERVRANNSKKREREREREANRDFLPEHFMSRRFPQKKKKKEIERK